MQWHTTIGTDTAKLFGHNNIKTRVYIDYFLKTLPKIQPDPLIIVGFTGYWDKMGDITAPRYAQTIDSFGRPMFFIDEHVIIQRYTISETLIYYNRTGKWENKLADSINNINWYNKVLKWGNNYLWENYNLMK